MNQVDVTQYVDMAIKRRWWIIIPFFLSCLGGLTYALTAERVYEAETLILVQSPKVPQDYVRSIISTSAEDRLRTITQEVTSRTNLEKIIEEYDLFSDPEYAALGQDQKVELLRKEIKIQISRGGTGEGSFSISFSGRDPEKVMQVTNALASRFITENLKIRETQALGTSSFLSDELDSVEKRLKDKEEELKQYREKYLGGLPEQLQTNLSILERLQQQLEQLNNNRRDAENRKIVIQQELAEANRRIAQSGVFIPSESEGEGSLIQLKNQLTALESKYTSQHPDVIRLQQMISKLEGKESGKVPGSKVDDPVLSQAGQELRRQLGNADISIMNSTDEIKKVKAQIEQYQNEVEDTPKREQELLSLKRDYSNVQALYNSLLERKLEAEIAVSMEKKQKGEQFRIIDPAKIPDRPVSPDSKKIILLSLALGLGFGGGLAFLMETMDTSYKSPEEVKDGVQLPILITLPLIRTENELKSIKRKEILAYTATGLAFVLSAASIVLATKGIDKTLEFFRNFLQGAPS